MAISTDRASAVMEAARELRPIIEARRNDSEQLRRQHDDVVAAMRERNLFRMMLPPELGGEGVTPMTYMRCVEEVAAMDGAAGWNLAIAGGGNVYAGYMQPELAREVCTDPDCCLPGMLAPSGRATMADGGYRVSGRWGWGSGIHHGTWALFGCIMFDGDKPRQMPNGGLPLRQMLLKRGEYEVLDTWYTGGMRGTGSADCVISDRFVPEEHSMLVFLSEPVRPEPLFRLPSTFFGIALSIVTAGIARASIDAMIDLAAGKTPLLSPTLLRDKPHVQHDVALADAMLLSSRDHLYSCMGQMWDFVVAGDRVPMEVRARTRAATVYAATTAARVVDMMHSIAGGSAVWEDGPFDRCHRDVHAALGHIALARGMMEEAGRVHLGLQTTNPMF